MAIVNNPSQINANMVRNYWDAKLYDESMFRDIFSALRTPFDRVSNIAIPMDAITMQINTECNNSYRTATLGFIHALQGTPREGDQQLQIGNEETLREKTMQISHNEFSHAVAYWKYGIHYHDGKYYGTDNMSMVTRLLGLHAEELAGYYYRNALLQRYSRNLTRNPTNLVQHWNSRVYVKGVADSAQPVYSLNLQTYTDSIAQSLVAAGTSAHLDSKFLNWLHYRLTMDRVEPITINGQKGFVLTVPPSQKFHVNALDNDTSVAGYWTSVNRMTDSDKANFPDLLGRWINIWLVEDERAPTLDIGGSSSPFTLTPGYVHPGNNDQRSNTVGTRDVSFILARAPIIDFYPTKIHHEYDDYNYNKWEGKGYFGMRGVQLRVYDEATASATNFEQRYCGVCLFARGDISNY